ncbi:response regulator [Microseira wollei]|uniref:Response regulator receiver protein n=1 Tax=Microseira wollei NIES-4236 TaxID=2530354 RepID=A0AAV3XMQ9_9CYAN|nr:response regulator [Microseira wollei]GET42928.1 response regulator receiver protein [Microseira wollei NIES-4236]
MTKHILVIDDEADIRDVMQMSLQGFAGWQVMQAESGSEGLLKAKAELFDAILLDISMPDLDGFECFEQLQADLKTQMIPVILLTAKALPSDRRRFAAMGVAGVIIKPFSSKQVWKQVAAILGWSV